MGPLSVSTWDSMEGSWSNIHVGADLHSGAALRRLLQDTPGGINNPRVHGYIASICFGLMLPLSMVLARNFKEWNPTWFHIHRVLGSVAYVAGIVGVSFGQAILAANPVPSYHQVLGWLVVALSSLQLSALAIRPPLHHQYRWVWAHYHHWSGRIGIAFAISNVYTGLHIAGEAPKFFWGYSIVLGCIVLLGYSKEMIDIGRLGVRDHTSIIAKVIALKEVEVADDVEASLSHTHVRRSSYAGPEEGGWVFRQSQDYRRSMDERRSSQQGRTSTDGRMSTDGRESQDRRRMQKKMSLDTMWRISETTAATASQRNGTLLSVMPQPINGSERAAAPVVAESAVVESSFKQALPRVNSLPKPE